MRLRLVAHLALVLSCSEPPAGVSSSAPAASSATAEPASSAFDQPAYCAKVCDRASACGVEMASSVAVKDRADEKGAIEQAIADRPNIVKSCVEACTKGPVSADDTSAVRAAEACVAEPSCAAFHKCLVGVRGH